MGRKDIAAKAYLRDNAVFADLVNVVLYGGEQRVSPEDLTEMDTNEVLLQEAAENGTAAAQRFRDGLKLLSHMCDGRQEYLILGIEPQSYTNYAMPVRTMLWDSLTYDRQVKERKRSRLEQRQWGSSAEFLSGFGKEDRLVPVLSIVLNLSGERWDGPLGLHEMLEVQDAGVLSWVNDYRIHLVDPHGMSMEEIELFRTDLRNVLKFIRFSGDLANIRAIAETDPGFHNMSREAAQLVNLYTNAGFKYIEKEGGRVDMCQAMIDLKEEGRQEGLAEGRQAGLAEGRQAGLAEGRQVGLAEGRKEKCIENAKALLDALDAETIAQKLKLPLETVLKLQHGKLVK